MSKPPVSARRVVVTSFVVDLSDVAFNILIAIISGSVVMLTEGLQGSADLTTSALLWVGVQRARRRANRQYPFGYGRELFFWSLMAGVSMLILTAGLSFYFGLQRFLDPQPISHLPLALVVLAIGVITNFYAFNLSLRRLGMSLRRPRHSLVVLRRSSLIESKSTLALDAMGTTAAFLGLLALGLYGLTGNFRYDGLGAMVVGATSGVFALLLIYEVKSMITGRSASAEVEAKVKDAVEEVKGVIKVLDLRTMMLGNEDVLVNVEVHVAGGLTTSEIEVLMDTIKRDARRAVGNIRHIQVEVETPGKRS